MVASLVSPKCFIHWNRSHKYLVLFRFPFYSDVIRFWYGFIEGYHKIYHKTPIQIINKLLYFIYMLETLNDTSIRCNMI